MSNQRALAISVAYVLSIIAMGLAWIAYEEKSRPKPPDNTRFIYHRIDGHRYFESQAPCERFPNLDNEGKQTTAPSERCVPVRLSEFCERQVFATNLCEWT